MAYWPKTQYIHGVPWNSSALWVSNHTPSHLSTVFSALGNRRNPHKETSDFKKQKHGNQQIRKIHQCWHQKLLYYIYIYIYVFRLNPMDSSWIISWILEVPSVAPGLDIPEPWLEMPLVVYILHSSPAFRFKQKQWINNGGMEWPTQQGSHKDQLEVWDTNTLMPLMSAKSIETKM